MTSGRLAEFLVWLAGDEKRLDDYNTDEKKALAMMADFSLSDEEKEALLSRDPTRIHRILSQSQSPDQPFIVPFGPVRGGTGSVNPLDWPTPVRFFEADPREREGGENPGTFAMAMPTRTSGPKRTTVKKRAAAGSRKKTAKAAGNRRATSRKRTGRKK